MKRNLLIGQSGGPTVAINASLAGAVREAMHRGEIGEIFGMCHGIQGVLDGEITDLRSSLRNEADFGRLRSTPAMALGSCRFKLPDYPHETYSRILKFLRERDIGYVLYIGGNDSMDTVQKLSGYLLREAEGENISVVGIPKTIDNDLPGTDHTPGFGSAARFVAVTVSQIARDCAVYNNRSVTIVEVMGRNAGWLTAASSLARLTGTGAPHLIYLPELPFSLGRFLEDVERAGKKTRHLVVAASEGLRLPDGRYVADSEYSGLADTFGHRYLSGIGHYLEGIVREKIACNVRSVNLNILQRCAAHLASETDLREAEEAGAAAVRLALSGKTGVMVSIERAATEPYRVRYGWCGVEEVANLSKTVPVDWIAPNGCDVTERLVRYLRPLVGGDASGNLPEYFELGRAASPAGQGPL